MVSDKLGTEDGIIDGATDGTALGFTLGTEEGLKDWKHDGTVVAASHG